MTVFPIIHFSLFKLMRLLLITMSLFTLLGFGCKPNNTTKPEQVKQQNTAKGKLFVIGGGKRSNDLMRRLTQEAGLDTTDFVAIFPLASEIPDSAFYDYQVDFGKIGFKDVRNYYFTKEKPLSPEKLAELEKAKLIYFTGGDQNIFMNLVNGTPVLDLLKRAYQNGATIAGTSAGAAVMSKKMITGNELKKTEYSETFRVLEADNLEIGEGLGFLPSAIIDQHFLIRSRHNRLFSAVIENPAYKCIGIDESTAMLVRGDSAEVVGDAQILVLENPDQSKSEKNGKLGAKNLKVSIFVAGEKFAL